jgi:DNA-binding NarL/FixJ family response regulator
LDHHIRTVQITVLRTQPKLDSVGLGRLKSFTNSGCDRTAQSGKTYVSPSITRRRPGRSRATPGANGGAQSPVPLRLTPREAEVLQLVAEGKANKQTAIALRISIKTVEKHRQSLMTKLDIHDVAGLTRYAIAIGSIEGRDRSVAS